MEELEDEGLYKPIRFDKLINDCRVTRRDVACENSIDEYLIGGPSPINAPEK